MSLAAVEVDPLRAPPPAGWDALVAAERLVVRFDSQLVRVASYCAQGPSSMVLVQDEPSGEPVALFYARHVGARDPRRFARPDRVAPLGITECRITPMLDTGIAFASELDQASRREAVRVFERAVRRRAGAGAHPIAYRAVSEPLLASVPLAGRRVMRQSGSMVIHNEWSDMAGYLAGLPRRWGNKMSRLYEEVAADSSVRFTVEEAIDPEQACWLADSVRRRRQRGVVPFPTLPASYFARFNAIPDTRYLVYRDRDDRLLAFVTFYDDGRDLHSGIWGYREQEDGGRRDLYFDVHLRQAELLIDRGRQRLLLGVGMEELKARFCARPEPRWGVFGLRAAPGDGEPPRRAPAAGPSAPLERQPLLVRVSRWLRQREGATSDGTRRVTTCPQCGQWSAVTVLRIRRDRARYWCRRCTAVMTGRADQLRPLSQLRPPPAGTATDPGPALSELLPQAMIRWMSFGAGRQPRRLPTAARLTKPVYYQYYRSWDNHLAAASEPELAELAVPGQPPPRAGLPPISAVVTALNGACYRSDLAVARLAVDRPDAARTAESRWALWERVEHARRWLALHGGELCWIHRVPSDGQLPAPGPEDIAAQVKSLRAGRRLEPAEWDSVRQALFGTDRGPRLATLLEAYPVEEIVAALEAYLASGERPLRERTLTQLAARPEPASPEPR